MTTDASPARLSAGTSAILVACGLVIGAWSTLCGIGGGVFAVPLLHYAFGMPLKRSVGSSLLLVAASTTSATLVELARSDSTLHGPTIAVLVATSFVGAQVGFRIARRLDARVLKAVFVIVLALVATDLFFGHAPGGGSAGAPDVALGARELAELAAIGFVAGVVAPILGVGGGLVAVPGMLFFVPALGYLGARAASTAMSAFTSCQSVLLYRREREVDARFALRLAAGALVGGWIGVALVHLPGAAGIAQRMLSATLYFAAARFALDVLRRGDPPAK